LVKVRYMIIILLFLSCVMVSLPAEETEFFSLDVSPELTVPLGKDRDLFKLGGGVFVTGNFAMPFSRLLHLTADAGYDYIPLANDADSFSLFSFGGGAGIDYPVLSRLSLYAYGKGGYFYAFLNDRSGNKGGNPWVYGGGGAAFRVSGLFSVGVEGSYRRYFGLYSDFGITLGTALHFGGSDVQKKPKQEKVEPKPAVEPKPELLEGEGLGITELSFTSIFPVFYSYYDDHPVGTAVLYNFEEQPAEDIELTFYVKQYMDNPKSAETPETLGPGEKAEIDICSLFTSDILEVTEGKKVSALINLSYTLDGEEKTEEFVESITVNNRNAMTWDDDRKVCAFVTAKDPAVMRFSKNVSGYIQGAGSRATCRTLRQAMAVHEALDIFGLSYIVDPTTPYEELSRQASVIDYLQFPKQTLEFKGGDCDDLSALYAAMLESLGIETAFITVPGHIYMAFCLGMPPEEAREQFDRPDNLIFEEGKVWVPLEITLRKEGFMRSWQEGAKEWRENRAKDQARLYPVHTGWEAFKPVGFPGTPALEYPEEDEVREAFVRAEKTFINQEILDDVALLRAKIDGDPENPKALNSLGVLYARYGLDDEAFAQFEKVLKVKKRYYPALINMGNIYYLRNDVEKALSYYQDAEQIAPENPTVLLCVSRTYHKLENYYGARQAYDKLKKVSPVLADRFAYLDLRGEEASRAAAAGDVEGVMVWEE